jgi:hypothetical protein
MRWVFVVLERQVMPMCSSHGVNARDPVAERV